MNIKTILLVFFILAVISAAIVAAYNMLDLTKDGTVLDMVSDNVIKLNDCNTVYWQEEEKTYGTCSDVQVVQNCVNQTLEEGLNYSVCSNELVPYEYQCLIDTKIVEKSHQDCNTKGYVIDNIIRLYTQKYACSTEENDKEVTVICDSRIDGNGDGACTSGETCMKFVINGDKVRQYERNSRDDFIETDQSFFLDRVPVEVLK